MQRIIGAILSFVGAFLLVAGVLAQVYAPDRLKRTPIDTESVTYLSGEAELSDGTGGTDTFPVLAYSTTLSDSEASTDDVVLYETSSCLVKDEGGIDGCVSADDPQERLLTASTATFATDRRTAEAVNDPDILPASAGETEGLVNKWPFDAEKTTYPYWDGTVGEAVEATYDREEEIDGLTTYVYSVSISDAPIEISDGVQGTYSDEKEVFVDPATGAIINQTDQQTRLDEEGNTFLAVDLAFTDEEVADNVEEAQGNADSLDLVTSTLPLVGYLVGIPLLVIGIVLLAVGMRRREAASSTGSTREG